MNNVLTFSDGHIEFWSTFSITHGLRTFNSPKKALAHMESANDGFARGVSFHKELNGVDLLSTD